MQIKPMHQHGHLKCESFSFMNAFMPLLSLDQAPVRQWHRIAIGSAHHPRLHELGFLPMESVRVLQRSWFKRGALVVQVGDAVFGLRPDEACQIEVHIWNGVNLELSAA